MAEKVKRKHSRHQFAPDMWRVRIWHDNGETTCVVRIANGTFLWTVNGWQFLCPVQTWTPLIKLLREVTR